MTRIRPRKGVFKYIAGLYTVLLLASTLLRSGQSDFTPRADQVWLSLPEFDLQSPTEKNIRLSYVDSGGDKPVILLLHGSPAASHFMMGMHDALAAEGQYRIITPDLPGFEGSSRSITDYSFASHASYISAFLDSLNIPSAHVIGYSMSGGVVAEMMHFQPEKLKSVVMLSSIGVQELELMGDYYLNHSVHALQYAALWTISEAVPHFGKFDDMMLGLPYARNFLDSDQRPLRSYLSAYSGPTLILHGEKDGLVPIAAALEHHRIIPQSELNVFPGWGHGIPFQHPGEVAAEVLSWVDRVEQLLVVTGPEAAEERVVKALSPFNAKNLPPIEGVGLVVLLLLIATATLISEDLAAIGAGLMVARGSLEFEMALLGAFTGIFIGDVGLYLAGRLLGARIISLPPFSWFVNPGQLARGTAWFKKEGAKVVLASRVIPGSRFPTYVAAGILKAPFLKFVGLFLIGTVIWTPIIVGVSTVMGNQILSFWALYESYALWVMIGLVLFVYGIFHVGIPLGSHVGRRKLGARWQRLYRWEFWPPFVFYPPLVIYVIYLAFKYRSLTAFTAVNPGIPDGGFVGESKAQILNLIASTPDFLAKYRLINVPTPPAPRDKSDAEADFESNSEAGAVAVFQFLEDERLTYPVVLKPDVGERGHGVFIIHSEEEVHSFFEIERGPTIVQEYISGEEFGVFYVRHPSEQNGSIISVTHKKLICVIGNGLHTLERLILDDDRARFMYKVFARRHAALLDSVIEKGISFQLVDVGTHARGALFLNGEHLITEELDEVFNTISVPIKGFYFGRFDVRVPSKEDLTQGVNIRILELNGVTSEATHIYDPSTRLIDAYRTLAHQWKLAFEIGTANLRSGGHSTSMFRLLALVIRYKIRPNLRSNTSQAARL
jgi:pimeloyl-ACP methyl ester carboxylesterase/membrane protein DedA with SNARE-associated domain